MRVRVTVAVEVEPERFEDIAAEYVELPARWFARALVCEWDLQRPTDDGGRELKGFYGPRFRFVPSHSFGGPS